MSVTARRMSTFEMLYSQLEALPANMRGQILEGELVAMTRPFSPHNMASLRMIQQLTPFDRRSGNSGGPGGWLFQIEPELHFPSIFFEKNVLIPDLAGWKRTRLPHVPRTGYLELAPDWVCEVLSPGTAGLDRGLKRRIYAEAGVEWLWLVDPARQSLEIERWTGTAWDSILSGAREDQLRAPPFEGLTLELGLLWEDVEGPG
jgi:Uma2 family endonuclease